MFRKARSGRDAFEFSLSGMRTIGSFTPAAAVADDRINRIIDERLGRNDAMTILSQQATIDDVANLASCRVAQAS